VLSGAAIEWLDLIARLCDAQAQPAWLLVAGSPERASAELLSVAAGMAAKVVAVDAGAATLMAAGISPSDLVGDLDSIDADACVWAKAQGAKVHAFDRRKDETDLQLALRLALGGGVASVVVASALGGRPDHQLAVLGACSEAASLRPCLISDEAAVVVCGAGQVLPIGALTGTGHTVSVMALADGTVVSETGMAWELAEAALGTLDPRGVSKVVEDEDAAIRVHSGSAAVIVPRSV
jgi:thiamine pyrophosphokinase